MTLWTLPLALVSLLSIGCGGTNSGTNSGADSGTNSGADSGTNSGTNSGADTGTNNGTNNGADDGSDGDTWVSYTEGFFVTYCVSCHSSDPKDFTQYDSVMDYADSIRCGVASQDPADCSGWPSAQQFPVGSGPFPGDDERDRVVAWLEAGAPE